MEEFRPLRAEHRSDLASFSCARFGQRWTRQVEDGIRGHVADALERGDVYGLGAWDEGRLCGLVVWKPARDYPNIWRSSILAVRNGYRSHGLGGRLKDAMLNIAREGSGVAVASVVHRENTRMREINEKRGGVYEQDAEDPDLLLYTIRL